MLVSRSGVGAVDAASSSRSSIAASGGSVEGPALLARTRSMERLRAMRTNHAIGAPSAES
jgi:hypothetical protein